MPIEEERKLSKLLLSDFQNVFEQSVQNGTIIGEHELDQMSIEELENMQKQLKTSVDDKKDKLFKQSTIGNRLSTKLKQIYETIGLNEQNIREFFESGNPNSISGEMLDDCIDRWNKEKQNINDKFKVIDQLLQELEH